MATEAPNPAAARNTRPYRLLDAWRGVAVLWVVMIHACLATIAVDSPELAHVPLYAFSLWGQLGVMIFFVISGYCIVAAATSAIRKPNGLLHFTKARVKRIYPPYFASTVIAVILGLLYAELARRGTIPKVNHPTHFLGQPFVYYFAALTLTQLPLHVAPVVVVYWSLCYEITFYVLVGLCMALPGRTSRDAFNGGMNAITILSLIWLIASPSTCPYPLNLWYQFGLGALIYMLVTQPERRSHKIVFGVTLLLIAIYAVVQPGLADLGHPSTRVQSLFCIFFAFVLLGLYRFDDRLQDNRLVKYFEWLGTISYSLYLSHFFVIPVPEQIAKRLGFTGGMYWVSFLVQIGVAIIVAYGFHLAFERPFLSVRAKAREATVVAPVPTNESLATARTP